MKLTTFSHTAGTSGWSTPELPAGDSPNTLVLVFGSSDFFGSAEKIAELKNKYPNSLLTGCSTSGEIFGTTVQDKSLSVAVAQFEKTELKLAYAEVAKAADSENAGRELAAALDRPDLKSVLLLSDGLNVNGTDLVHGISSILPKSVIVTGGLAGDGANFKRTWVIQDGTPKTNRIAAVGFYGNHIRIGHGSQHGWENFGPERTVTHSEGNVLYKLDNKPALELYKEYLGERAQGLPATGLLFPLSLRSSKTDEIRLVRTILGVDEAKQSMTFAGDITQGHLAQLMRANFDRLVDGAADAAKLTRESAGAPEAGQPTLCLAISCVGRRLVLGERTEDEVEAIFDRMPKDTQQVGFYSYGEISPFGSGQSCDLHNQTMTLTTLSEI